MTEIRYATARQHYTCTGCRKRIASGTLYAYALDSRKRRTRYHRSCAPAKAQYAERRAEKGKTDDPD